MTVANVAFYSLFQCYKAIGFEEVDKEISPLEVMGQSFAAKEMIIEKK